VLLSATLFNPPFAAPTFSSCSNLNTGFLVSVGVCTNAGMYTNKLYAISVGIVQSQHSTVPSVHENYDDSTYAGLMF
jgi:hypothetical protein